MLTNTAITVYNWRRDPATKVITYLSTVLDAVHWEPVKGVSIGTNGVILDVVTASDKVQVFIPFTVGAGAKTFADPKTFAALSSAAQAGRWTLTPGKDIIRKGADANAPQSLSEAQAKAVLDGIDEAYRVTTVNTFDMGSASMRHWEVGGE